MAPAYFDATSVTIFKDFEKKKTYEVSQTTEQMSITFTIPSTQVVYFTFEKQNSRFQKYCTDNDLNLNFFMWKGSGGFPGMDALEADTGVISYNLFHTTLAVPDKVYDAGTYTVLVANWSFADLGPVKYMLTVYQEGSGKVQVSY